MNEEPLDPRDFKDAPQPTNTDGIVSDVADEVLQTSAWETDDLTAALEAQREGVTAIAEGELPPTLQFDDSGIRRVANKYLNTSRLGGKFVPLEALKCVVRDAAHIIGQCEAMMASIGVVRVDRGQLIRGQINASFEALEERPEGSRSAIARKEVRTILTRTPDGKIQKIKRGRNKRARRRRSLVQSCEVKRAEGDTDA